MWIIGKGFGGGGVGEGMFGLVGGVVDVSLWVEGRRREML
jgi:hypothetical protein